MATMIKIRCPVKNYDWGKIGRESILSDLLVKQNVQVDSSKPYAEYWMGTHKSGSAIIDEESREFGGKSLSYLLETYPEFAGNLNIINKYGRDLPFLFKVLSVGKPLSLQVHPNKTTAEELNKTRPENYPDDNHKPEMAIALTKFKALAYFRQHDEICEFLSILKPVQSLIGEDVYLGYLKADDKKDHLRKCFVSILTADEEDIKSCLNELMNDYLPLIKQPERDIFQMLRQHYPNDSGCLSVFFLNYLEMNPGEAIFIDANEPHCYLQGDCIECMAKSDNVIRAGLTPKYKDIQLLTEVLSYTPKTYQEFKVEPLKENCITEIYRPPVNEFAIERIRMICDKENQSKCKLSPKTSGSIVIVINGSAKVSSGTMLKEGNAYFIPAEITTNFSFIKGDFEFFRAFVNC